jgi:hypothetical protein
MKAVFYINITPGEEPGRRILHLKFAEEAERRHRLYLSRAGNAVTAAVTWQQRY